MMRSRRSNPEIHRGGDPGRKPYEDPSGGLLSESGKAKRPWEFIVVKDKAMLDELAGAVKAELLC